MVKPYFMRDKAKPEIIAKTLNKRNDFSWFYRNHFSIDSFI